jgi:hypothetical protein
MELKRAKVVMLPCSKPRNVLFNKKTNEYRYSGPLGSLSLGHLDFQPQLLYFTTDEEIKEGDWGYDTVDNAIFQMNNQKGIDLAGDKVRKIVATTDTKLKIGGGTGKREDGISIPLPQPSQAFIKKCCKVGGIDEVLVEYTNRCCGRCLPNVDECVSDTMCKKHRKEGCEECYGLRGDILKVDSHNTITIHPIKDSWNREEVIALIRKYRSDDFVYGKEHKRFKEWIKENL